jgi:hypothetical protein
MRLRNRHSASGGVLVTTLIICALVGIMLVAYLAMVSSQHKFSQRSQVWNNCVPMCEAGIEEALAHLNHINTTSNFAINGWTSNSAAYHKKRSLNGGVASMSISNDSPPTIFVTASLQSPVQSDSITRRIRVKTRLNQKFPNGILSKGGVSLGGSGRIDSFNSALPGVESDANGQYTAGFATDRATVVTTANAVNIIQVGNMSIYGSIATGPGGNATLGPNGNVGDKPFNDNPSYDGMIQAGHRTDDVNVYIPDAVLPTDFAAFAPPPAGGFIGIIPYQYILGNADYRIAAITVTSMMITGKARIHVLSTTTLGVGSQITIATNGSVEWYCGGNATFGGNGVVNVGGRAKDFSIIGLKNCFAITYSGSSRFVGTAYAPYADVTLTGTADAIGAIVSKTFRLSGAMGLHYDESLKGDPKKNRYIAASWQEL